jgi:arylformamidase
VSARCCFLSACQDDAGALPSHRVFWDLPARGTATASDSQAAPEGISNRTITELCYVDNALADGLFLLALGVAPLAMDASPSRPMLLPVAVAQAASAGVVGH